ncbi:MAG: leucine-rich repeat domain-containing protein [Mycoplasmoidaceae bacterium]|nr:leucine-rich repeat domain-containing protein [Mycoplasmoidaceae bacterium]
MKKTIKKIMTGIITACMVLCVSSITAFAADTVDLAENDSSANSIVQYTMDSSWEASIPAFITPSEQAEINTEQYSVDVSDIMLSNDEALSTTIEYDGVLVEANGVEIPYTLYDANGEISTGDEIISADSGNPDAIASYKFGASLNQSPKYAGTYMGTATFNFSTVSNKIVYSAEDIEKDEHLFGIGATKDEYVIAKFNDDYTAVTIFANATDSDGIIKDFGNTYDSADTWSPMTQNKETLKSVEIKENVISIGKTTFSGCKLIPNITIPESVTTIGDGAFINCSSLKNVNIPDGVAKIGTTVFAGCSSLVNIDIPDSVTIIGNSSFLNCTSLKNIDIPNSVTTILGYAFMYCTSLENVNMANSVTEIYPGVFKGCTSLVSVTVSDKITSIDRTVFQGCSNLKTICGQSDSYAETWANSNGYTFVAID